LNRPAQFVLLHGLPFETGFRRMRLEEKSALDQGRDLLRVLARFYRASLVQKSDDRWTTF
jgi:hypothetical protein